MNSKKQNKAAILTTHQYCEENMRYYAMLEKYLTLNNFYICDNLDVDYIFFVGCGTTDEKFEIFRKFISETDYLHEKIILMGCLSKTHLNELNTFFNGKIIPYGDEKHLDEAINASISFASTGYTNVFSPLTKNNIKANPMYYIKISDGCWMECTFCIIKKAHGYLRSESKESILKQYLRGLDLGYRKFYLMGTDSFAYGYDIDTNIFILINELHQINNNAVFFLGNLHPRWLIKYENELKKICQKNILGSLQCAIQHVNQEILKRMGRDVDFKKTYEIIKEISRLSPELFMSADLISGFPSETDDIFNEMIEFIKADTCFNMIQHFSYKDNKCAQSYNYDNKIRDSIKLLRWKIMNDTIGKRLPETVFKERFTQTGDDIYQYYTDIYVGVVKEGYFFCKNTYLNEKVD